MSEDGAGWPDIPGEPHDDAGTEPFHDEPGYEPGHEPGYEPGHEPGYEPGHEPGYEPGYEVGHEPGYEVGHEPGGLAEAQAPGETMHPADADILLDAYSPPTDEPGAPEAFEPGATLFGWTGEQPSGDDVPPLVIEPGYLEAHYATGWALDPHGDGAILAAQDPAPPPGGEHDPLPDPRDNPAGTGLDHGLQTDVLYGGGWT
jgi:hypothetical protein